MSIKSAPYYWLTCDEPDCGVSSCEGTEHSAWQDKGYALDGALDSDWIEVEGKHYCDDHANKHDPDLKEDCDGSVACDSLSHIEGCFATNPDFAATGKEER